ncbi:MAG: hypothetical protein K0R38_5032 [Polyangiaceae bacterium]|nr:hypothetical protein [Polyangiaceae bacterium]
MLIDAADLRGADLFFHVFAHVSETAALPASVASPSYVGWCERYLGDVRLRTLGEDARVLAREFRTHESLASVQPLAKLFHSLERLAEVGARSLAELSPTDVDAPWALAHLRGLGPSAELAFCALLLELPSFLQLPAPPAAPRRLESRLKALANVAPGLARSRVGCIRSLHLHGRVWGDEIWVGHPAAEVAPSLEHAAWQAAHEATVVEVARERPELGERTVEAQAVERLTRRAAVAGESAAHAAWLHAH